MASRKETAPVRPEEAAPPPDGAGKAEPVWRLPSGQDLVSFALATGFAAQPLLEEPAGPEGEQERVQERPETVNGSRREV